MGVFATKGILGEMAGDIGDVCYTQVANIMRLSRLTAVIFTTGEELDNQLIGSMLIFESKHSVNYVS